MRAPTLLPSTLLPFLPPGRPVFVGTARLARAHPIFPASPSRNRPQQAPEARERARPHNRGSLGLAGLVGGGRRHLISDDLGIKIVTSARPAFLAQSPKTKRLLVETKSRAHAFSAASSATF